MCGSNAWKNPFWFLSLYAQRSLPLVMADFYVPNAWSELMHTFRPKGLKELRPLLQSVPTRVGGWKNEFNLLLCIEVPKQSAVSSFQIVLLTIYERPPPQTKVPTNQGIACWQLGLKTQNNKLSSILIPIPLCPTLPLVMADFYMPKAWSEMM